ncbi:hypothetical protein D9757_010256 [Collybiopsis confluens]|uniref:Uncharacterized protein n=1 Tax=Collybiopsis confluens TaxID=2823264 RepID=A0A8H5HAW9_9AGAR|nr:hypothetical protein D9757_010256 [Collybiopsis confluens]
MDRRHVEMKKLLGNMLNVTTDSVTATIEGLPIRWNGETIKPSSPISPNIVKQMLWELAELNFRHDLVMLDKRVDLSHMGRTDRERLLSMCWEGDLQCADFWKAEDGIGSSDIKKRYSYLRSLHHVMTTWRGNDSLGVLESLPDHLNDHNFHEQLERFETVLAKLYTRTFLRFFGRAASIPFHLSIT